MLLVLEHIAEVIIAVGQPLAKNRPISKIVTHFLVWSDTCQIREEWLYIVVLTCVVGVADKTTLFCCWETNKPGGATVHYSVNKYSEVNTKGGGLGGRLANWHVRSIIRLI